MRPGAWSRAELKLECLRRVERSDVTGWCKQVLVNWIETYVELSGEDAAEFLWLLELDENREIQDMELSVESLVEMVERLPTLESIDDLIAHQRGPS